MLLKAGTYRFNDNINFDIEPNVNNYYKLKFSNEVGSGSIDFDVIYIYVQSEDIQYGQSWAGEYDAYIDNQWLDDYQTVRFVYDEEVDDTFGTWFISNTNYNEVNATPLATIEYNGQTIAQLNAGETATLSCEGKKMASDVVVKVNKVEEPVDDSIVGTWVFNESLSLEQLNIPSGIYSENHVELIFTERSDGAHDRITFEGDVNGNIGLQYSGSPYNVYDGGWDDEIYRTITIYSDVLSIRADHTSTPDFDEKDFITWLKANATKQ